MSAGKVFLHIIGAGGLLGITFAFFWGINWADTFLGGFSVVTYLNTVWIMSGVLAFLIVLSAIAKDHARLEMLSSGTFLIYIVVAYMIGGSILSVFMPYNGFGQLNVQLAANLAGLGIIPVGTISANIVYVNTMAATFIVVAQALKFFKTFVKSMKEFKEVPGSK
jgi:hypothetical protein